MNAVTPMIPRAVEVGDAFHRRFVGRFQVLIGGADVTDALTGFDQDVGEVTFEIRRPNGQPVIGPDREIVRVGVPCEFEVRWRG